MSAGDRDKCAVFITQPLARAGASGIDKIREMLGDQSDEIGFMMGDQSEEIEDMLGGQSDEKGDILGDQSDEIEDQSDEIKDQSEEIGEMVQSRTEDRGYGRLAE
eukprot:GFUD01130279.1.p1 GENE.GFUD01130279.1~~GFUD01130279.1.p1  ORF type:complete len:105 (+),score=20.81 GFUD01130279.1:2-316(+)